MADINQDLLALQYSQDFTIEGLQEADVNLQLPPAPSTLATVFGVVTDGTAPLADATVKLFDSTGQPYQHTMTDASGSYLLDGIPAGAYSVAAVKDGYLLSGAVSVTLVEGGSSEVGLVCVIDPTLSLGTIAGVLSVAGPDGTLVPLEGAKLTLMDAASTVLASTYTAADGEFVFYDVADGAYSLMAAAAGYRLAAPVAVAVTGGSTVNVALSMAVDTRTYNGTVSGTIRDSLGAAVAGCFVGLYQVSQEAGAQLRETLVATTKTNQAGQYLFGGVSGGQYLVKAKLSR